MTVEYMLWFWKWEYTFFFFFEKKNENILYHITWDKIPIIKTKDETLLRERPLWLWRVSDAVGWEDGGFVFQHITKTKEQQTKP